jgi:hypothetical protein
MASRGFALERSQEVYRAISRTEDYPTYFASSGLVFVRQ